MHDMPRTCSIVEAARARCHVSPPHPRHLAAGSARCTSARAFSCTEIVDCIYHGLMRRKRDGTSPDTFLMSKGHGCMIQYVILEDLGVLSTPTSIATASRTAGSACHPDYGNPGIEASTGSLGHGLSMVVGMALAERGRETDGIIYTVLSDGEVQEGSTWEAVLMASSLGLRQHRRLRRQQRFPEPRPHLGDASVVLSAGRQVRGVRLGDGRDRRSRRRGHLRRRSPAAAAASRSWSCAKTTKGKGVSYMENVPIWHYRSPNKEEYEQAHASSWRRRRHEEHLLRGALRGGDRQSRHLHRRGRHLAGRQHGEVQHSNIPSASSTSASPSRA